MLQVFWYVLSLLFRASGIVSVAVLFSACGGSPQSGENPGGSNGAPPDATMAPTALPQPSNMPTPLPTVAPSNTPRPIATAIPTPQNTATPRPESTPQTTPSPQTSPSPQATPSPQASPTVSPSQPPLVRATNTTCVAPPQGAQSGDYALEAQFTNTGFPRLRGLLGLYQIPGDNSIWYALLRGGEIKRFANSQNTTQIETFLRIDGVDSSNEKGLLGFAFHPNYRSNGYIYVNYSDANNRGRSTISRFQSQNGAAIDASTEKVILTLTQPAGNHNGGDIRFGPDGYLYIGFGDGGGAGDTFRNGQNKKTFHSKLLRINVDATSAGKNYSVPRDNPFVNDSRFLPEIYARGLRNPWRFSFDIQNGDLWLADVGQDRLEEVNLVKPGENFGWPVMEGSACFRGNGCNSAELTLPVAEYDHSDGACSVTGGYVYRGSSLPGLNGNYVYADYCNGAVRRTFKQSGQWKTEAVLDARFEVVAFAQDNDGEMYILDINGRAGRQIFKIVSRGNTPPASNIPSKLSETGCYRSTQNKTFIDALVPYDVISVLWSDGAEKRRAFAIPDGTVVSLTEDGDFEFPLGSILVKEFLDGNTHVETRLLMHHENGWLGYSYEWLDDQSDAILLKKGKTKNTGNFVHTFPSAGECQNCHTAAANISLGLEGGQLNHSMTYSKPVVRANQLDALYQAGFLANKPNTAGFAKLVALDDRSASLNDRARSYLHSNCSGCHRPGAQGSIIDLRQQTALADTGACDTRPNVGDLGITNARIIALGASNRSTLLARMRDASGDDRMPPLASFVEDSAATDVIQSWIDSLTSCR